MKLWPLLKFEVLSCRESERRKERNGNCQFNCGKNWRILGGANWTTVWLSDLPQ